MASKIKIKPENKGKFTKWAKAHGMSVQQAASHVLRNRSRYSPTLIKRANFARNAAKWEDGGQFEEFGLGGILSTVGSAASLVPTPWTKLAGGALSLVGGIIGGSEVKREEERELEMSRQREVDVAQNTAQASILNNYPATFKTGGRFKGKRFGGTPNAEVEGGEVILTPDGLSEHMIGPSHTKGGIDVKLPNNSLIISKKYAKDILPYTSKINKAREMLNSNSATKLAKDTSRLNLNKYYSKVLDAYNRQEKSKRKFQSGGKYRGFSSTPDNMILHKPLDASTPVASSSTNRSGFIDGGYGMQSNWVNPMDISSAMYNTPQEDIPYMNPYSTSTGPGITFSNPYDDPNSVSFDPARSKADTFRGSVFDRNKTNWGNVASSVGELAPTLYNLGMGLFGRREKLNARNYANPYEAQINSLMANRKYDITPDLVANENAYRTGIYNLRNLGGSRGQIMSNMAGLQNAKMFGDMSAYSTKKNMENQYAAEYAQSLYPLGRDTVSTRMFVDETNAMNRAAGRNMIGAGMSGLQRYLLTRRQMGQQKDRDDLMIEAIKGFSPYAEKWIPGLKDLIS